MLGLLSEVVEGAVSGRQELEKTLSQSGLGSGLVRHGGYCTGCRMGDHVEGHLSVHAQEVSLLGGDRTRRWAAEALRSEHQASSHLPLKHTCYPVCMRRTAEEAARTRVALLHAALMAFEEKGWRGATFEHVAERAGLTRGALHHHFRTKNALLTEALEWGWAEYGARLFDLDAPVPDAQQWLHDLLTDFVTLLRSDDLFRALASTTVLVAPQSDGDTTGKHTALDGWREQIVAVLDRANPALPGATVAGLVLVVLQGLTVTAVTRPDDLPRPADQDAAIAALVRGLLT